ncbi:MAG: Flp family type IVb pilin [Firmicutes bacterium]|nr:Flp family type IVb pilin [Bacillota bacterium]
MLNYLKKLHSDEKGIELMEWAALGVLIVLAVWGAVQVLGGSLSGVFDDIQGRLGH